MDGAGALVPSPADEGEDEQPLSRPGKQAKGSDAAMQTSMSVDKESHACEARVGIGLGLPKLLMLKLVEQVAAETVVKATPGAAPALLLGSLPHHDVLMPSVQVSSTLSMPCPFTA